MKEARAVIRDSYRREVLYYLESARNHLIKKHKEDEAFIVEMIYDVIKETSSDKQLEFSPYKLGL